MTVATCGVFVVLFLILFLILLLLLPLQEGLRVFEVVLRVFVPGVQFQCLFVGRNAFRNFLLLQLGVTQVVKCLRFHIGIGGFRGSTPVFLRRLAEPALLVQGISEIKNPLTEILILFKRLPVVHLRIGKLIFLVGVIAFADERTFRLCISDGAVTQK